MTIKIDPTYNPEPEQDRATARPWPSMLEGAGVATETITGGREHYMQALCSPLPFPENVPYVFTAHGNTKDEAEANCALIVRAVNAHEALVDALKDLVKWMDDSDLSHTKGGGHGSVQYGAVEFGVVAAARSALALAKGE